MMTPTVSAYIFTLLVYSEEKSFFSFMLLFMSKISKDYYIHILHGANEPNSFYV
jgi:hypothetical protein